MLSIPKSIHDDTWWYIRHYILYTRIAHISTGQRNNLPEVYMYICIYLNIYRKYTYIYIQTYIRHTQSYPLRPFEDLLLWHPSPGLGKRSAGLQVGPNNPTMKKNNSKGRRIEGGLQLGILGKFWNMFRNWLIFNLMYNINCHKLPFSLKPECIQSLSGSSPSSRAFAVLLLGVRLSQRFRMRHTAVKFIALVVFLLSYCTYLHTNKKFTWQLKFVWRFKRSNCWSWHGSNPCIVISLERFIPTRSMVLAYYSPIIYHKDQPSTCRKKTVRPMGIRHGDLPGRAVSIVTSRLSTALVLAIIALICLPEKEGCCLPGVVGWLFPLLVFYRWTSGKRCFPWLILRILYLFGESWTCGWWDQLPGLMIWSGLYVDSGKYGQPRYTSDLTSCCYLGRSWFLLPLEFQIHVVASVDMAGTNMHLMHVVDTPVSDSKLVGSWASRAQESCLFTPHIVLWVALWSPGIVSIINQNDWYKMSQAQCVNHACFQGDPSVALIQASWMSAIFFKGVASLPSKETVRCLQEQKQWTTTCLFAVSDTPI